MGNKELPPIWERVANSACPLFLFVDILLYLSVFPYDVENLMWSS